MSVKKILLFHPLLDWYVEHGLVVTKVHSMIHSKKWKCFEKFGKFVSDERRKGDIDEDYKIIADEMKNIGNSAYGRTSMNKSKHANISYKSLSETKKKQLIHHTLKIAIDTEIFMKYKQEKKSQSRICLYNCHLLFYHMLN